MTRPRKHPTSYTDPRMRKGRTGRPFRRWRAKVLEAQVLMCIRCGGPIDKRVRYPHPMSPSADHIIPLTRGGAPLDPANGGPAHLVCNQRHGNGDGPVVVQASRPVADRRW